jgi:hypothetical protein
LAFREVGRQGAEEERGRELGGDGEKNPKNKSHFHSSFLQRSLLPLWAGCFQRSDDQNGEHGAPFKALGVSGLILLP